MSDENDLLLQALTGRRLAAPQDLIALEAQAIAQNYPGIQIGQRIKGAQLPSTGDSKKDLAISLLQGLAGDFVQSNSFNAANEQLQNTAKEFYSDPLNYKGNNLRLQAGSKLLQFQDAVEQARNARELEEFGRKEIFKNKLQMARDEEKRAYERDRAARELTAREDQAQADRIKTQAEQDDFVNADYDSLYPEIKEYIKNQVKLGVVKKPEDLKSAVTAAYGDLDNLRKELTARKEIAKYSEVKNIYKSMQENLKNPSMQSDLDYVYGVAKILDPGSVVRESEGQMVIVSSDPFVNRQVNKLYSEVQSTGKLTAKARSELIKMLTPRVKSMQDDKKKVFEVFSGIAKKRGYDASSLGDYAEDLNFETMIDSRAEAIETALAQGYTREQIEEYLKMTGR